MIGGSAGFSRNASMSSPLAAVWMMPKPDACALGTRIPATVTPAPEAMCSSTICEASIR